MSKYGRKLSSLFEENLGGYSKSFYEIPKHLEQVLENANFGKIHIQKISQESPGHYDIDIGSMRHAMNLCLQGYHLNEDTNELTKDSKYSKSVNWFPTDSREHYENNMQDSDMKSLMHKLGWVNNDGTPAELTYNLNKHGFRSVEFEKEGRPGILTLGCSFAFGVGLKNNQTFAQKVANHFELENYNLGMPGRGLDLTALYLSLFIEKELDPSLIKAVVVYTPPPGRETMFNYHSGHLRMTDLHNDIMAESNFYTDNHLRELESYDSTVAEAFKLYETDDKDVIQNKLDSGLQGYVDNYRSKLYEHNMQTQENNFKRDILATNTIKLFCLEHNIPLVIKQSTARIATAIDFARDMMHFGPKTHSNIAKDIIAALNIYLT